MKKITSYYNPNIQLTIYFFLILKIFEKIELLIILHYTQIIFK